MYESTCMGTRSLNPPLIVGNTFVVFPPSLLPFAAQPQTNSTKNSIVTSPKGNVPSPALVFTSSAPSLTRGYACLSNRGQSVKISTITLHPPPHTHLHLCLFFLSVHLVDCGYLCNKEQCRQKASRCCQEAFPHHRWG